VLSDGRVELGLGAGGFWDAVVSAGGPRLDPKAVDALVEAIGILRDSWDGHDAVNRNGQHYDISGFHPCPHPSHRDLAGRLRLGEDVAPALRAHFS
jgi:alkanesulfonate monooxygenase SsuD/methylene tetrahydromethanopterin reductase-like flavin-dependent oxidoreductase (luciferase family)